MKWKHRMLLHPENNGGNSNESQLQRQLTELQAKYDELSKQHNELTESHAKLSLDFDKREKELEKSNRLLEKANTELGGYKSTEARKAKIAEILESPDFKGKINLDVDKAMRYLSKGTFNQETLDSEVKEAIELFGTEVTRSTGLSDRGAGKNAAQTNDPSNKIADPLGAALLG
jgi:chromosome segregation ATPase